jgi:hypothetical protein
VNWHCLETIRIVRKWPNVFFKLCVSFKKKKKLFNYKHVLIAFPQKNEEIKTNEKNIHKVDILCQKMFVPVCLGPKDSKTIRRHSFRAESGPREYRHRIPNWKLCSTHSWSPQRDLAPCSLYVPRRLLPLKEKKGVPSFPHIFQERISFRLKGGQGTSIRTSFA